MAEDEPAATCSSWPIGYPPEPSAIAAATPGAADSDSDAAIAAGRPGAADSDSDAAAAGSDAGFDRGFVPDTAQKLPPAQTLPPQSVTEISAEPEAGIAALEPSQAGEAIRAAADELTAGPNQPPVAGPPTYPGLRFVPPGYPAAGVGSPDGPPQYQPQPGYLRPPYGPPPYGPPPYGPPQYGPPSYGPPPYPTQPPFGSVPYGPPAYPAPGWPAPRQGSWGIPGSYLQPGWGYQPAFAPMSYAPPGPGPGLQWGGIGVRLGALLIDGVILVCSLFAVGLILTAIDGPNSSSRSDNSAATAIGLIWWLVALSYHPVSWYVFGATLGQKALGLRVAQASNGRSLGIGAVLVRYLIFFMVTVAFPLGVVSAVMASNDPFKRAWHDDVARSVVVKH